MTLEETVTFLEMTSPGQLRPGRSPPSPLTLEQVGGASLGLVRSTYERIAAAQGWRSRRDWSEEEWEELLARPGVDVWLARVGDEVAGLVELEAQPRGAIEITVFGLVPGFVGRGFGGHLLTLATSLAWSAKRPDGLPATRVWLHTSTRDHPHARPNYERRGFRPFRTEKRGENRR